MIIIGILSFYLIGDIRFSVQVCQLMLLLKIASQTSKVKVTGGLDRIVTQTSL